MLPGEPRERLPWRATFTTEKGSQYDIERITSEECPVTAITPLSDGLYALLIRNRRIRDATGATLCGPDAGKWPAVWSDAVDAFRLFEILENNARVAAEMEERERERG